MNNRVKFTHKQILIVFYCSIIFLSLVWGFFRYFYNELATFLSNMGFTYLKITFWVSFAVFFLLILLMFADLIYNERFHFIIITFLALYGILILLFISLFLIDPWFFLIRDFLYFLNDTFLLVISLDLYLFMMYENKKLIN